ncbi:MAG: hypothetical protein KAS15_07745 [Nanoarchaeota archaeon]|nr:hypothetical protein [Nanoarchaeota archaeon]
MRNKFDNDDRKEEQLEVIAENLHRSVEKNSKGAIIIGSFAHSKGYAIRQGTDIDAMVFCNLEEIKEILQTSIYEYYEPVSLDLATKYFLQGITNLMSTRHDANGSLVTVHYMTPQTFVQKFANGITPNILHSFRKVPKEYIYRFKNFAGDSIAVPVENEAIEGGYRTPMETSKIVGDHYYSGSPHNKLMSAPTILFDKEGFIQPAIDKLRIDLAKRLLYEHGKYINQTELSVVNTLIRQEKIKPDILQDLYEREKETFEGVIN